MKNHLIHIDMSLRFLCVCSASVVNFFFDLGDKETKDHRQPDQRQQKKRANDLSTREFHRMVTTNLVNVN